MHDKVTAAIMGGGVGGSIVGLLIALPISFMVPKQHQFKVLAAGAIIGIIGIGTLAVKSTKPAAVSDDE